MPGAARFFSGRPKPLFQHLQLFVSLGLRTEYTPIWPLPLPAPRPHDAGKPTLVLDIDETLLHTVDMQPAGDDAVAFAFFLRPHVREFLSEVRELYEVVFWTAGTASYCSAVLDALEVQVLELPRSFYNLEEMKLEAKGLTSTKHANFYSLSRTQTLQEHEYMKYLPMLGRPLDRVIMIDDSVRSFPLHPRNGIKIPPFIPDVRVLAEYSHAVDAIEKESNEDKKKLITEKHEEAIRRGEVEIARLQRDRALPELLPLLRAAAGADDLIRELDHWRDDEYVRCDDFRETMNRLSVVRQRTLGEVLKERRASPIPPLKQHVLNHGFIEEANTAMKLAMTRRTLSRL
ncbi:putative NLI-interacting factor [Trypanosoma vivax]|nr:putative NLI-interacting factor [Trypanosoma vivax]